MATLTATTTSTTAKTPATTAASRDLARSRSSPSTERITGRLIVCLASAWDIDPTSKHQLMRRLARRNDVIWVNYHASRRPRLTRGDVGSSFAKLARALRGPLPIHKRMVQLTPLVLPGPASPLRDRVNRFLVVHRLRRTIRRVRRSPDQPIQLWTFAPDTAYLAGALGEERLVYYCVDEFSEFAGFDRDATRTAERTLIDRCDVVITSAQQLYTARRELHPHVHLVRHGVDHVHFARAVRRDLPIPDDLKDIPRPIAGFIGLVQHWFDAALLAEVARRLPDVSFVIVGECAIDTGSLARQPNVHCLGRRPYAALPAYCAAFDVGLIPFVRSPLTDNVNPIKLREYLAAGLPVVSTDLPEVRAYAPDVICTDEAVFFARAVRDAVAQTTPDKRRARSQRVAGESWDAVTAHVEHLVCTAKRTCAAD